jgi:hypothetical protein
MEELIKKFYWDYSKLYKLLNKDNEEVFSFYTTFSLIVGANLISIYFIIIRFFHVDERVFIIITIITLFLVPYLYFVGYLKKIKKWIKNNDKSKIKTKMNLFLIYFIISCLFIGFTAMFFYLPEYKVK